MDLENIFKIANALALLSWIYLAIFPFRPATSRIIMGTVVMLLCSAYAFLVFQSIQPADWQQFNSLAGIQSLLSSPGAALVGWLHYLAFDLMVGLFIAANAAKHGIRHWTILPCFFFTFMLGPVGLLLYLLVRWAVTRDYLAENF
ncbi:MAG: ABA4-like family protein [Chitinophagaceae bacterium]|jgi:hypothetical protein|nr:ABA4-like family protein [Chitinophagaceae bacterium]